MVFRRFFQSSKTKPFFTIPADAAGLHFLYQTKPELFFQFVNNDDAEQRVHAFKLRFHDGLLCEIMRYATRHDATVDADLQRHYAICTRIMPDENRRAVHQAAVDLIQNASLSAHALLPFIWGDTDRFVVGPAVIDLLDFAPQTDNDPMSRPRDIIAMIEAGMIQNPGAAFGGLLHLGNREVCDLIAPLKDRFGIEEVLQGVMTYTGLLSAACVEFEIAWLEELAAAKSPLFTVVATGLRAQRSAERYATVMTGTRKFPQTDGDKETLARLVPIGDYTKSIAPKLYFLEQAEPPPRTMPSVLKAWGLEPLSRPEETAGSSAGLH